MPTFVARPAFGHLLMILIASLAFVFGGLWIAGLLGEVPKPGKEWVGWLSVMFFGLCAVAIFIRLFDRDDQSKISSFGIYWKQWSRDTIPWSEIDHVSVWEYKKQKSILLHLRNPERYPSTTLLGKLAKANRALTGGDIALNTQGTDKSFDDAMSAIAYFRTNQNAKQLSAPTSASVGFGKRGL